MTTIVFNRTVISICVVFLGVLVAYGGQNKEYENVESDYVEIISEKATGIICSDDQFLSFTGLSSTDCAQVIATGRHECDEGMDYLVPAITGDEDEDLLKKKLAALRKLGALYGECLQNLAYEKGYCRRNVKQFSSQ